MSVGDLTLDSEKQIRKLVGVETYKKVWPPG